MLYLFCLLEAPEGLAAGTDPGRGVDWVAVQDTRLLAATTAVPNEEFSEAGFRAKLTDLAWLAEKAQWHDRTVAGLMELATVLPFKLGTAFAGEEELKRFLGTHAQAFTEKLAYLRGTVECGIKAFFEPSLFAEWVQQDPLLQDLKREMEAAPPGKAYLLQKKWQQLQKSVQAQRQGQLLEQVWAYFGDSILEFKLNKPHSKELSGSELEMVLNAAVLLKQEQLAAFEQQFDRAQSLLESSGLILARTGPWSPYHFATLTLDRS